MEVNKAIKVLIGWQECCGGWTITLKEKDSEELGGIISLLKSLESENKKLKKENKAYKGMWEESKKRFFSCEIVEVAEIINKLEQEYLGGGE